ncbi:Glutamyl-tRNA(Gln) amidotransferase subunit A [Geodia barretti]|uniref:Glutamyl-tRNA(Gln) amidotransferase subunit A n=1 Tax=Geodia barretti TaxID=519541 RepID=A0AA35X903_GEOBA|nr:Glutamyl-tRNA(Gln) amidotransferase subunit A [Geodia barretti]
MTKLKEAGAVLLGKLNMSEFAMGDAFHHPYGRPRNPWDLSRNPGTSSSGSGAATAAFLCATSLGEDTAGSIRGRPTAFLRPAIAGHDPNDSHTRNAPVPDYLEGIDGGIQGLRVGVLSDRVNDDGVEPDVRDASRTRAVQVDAYGRTGRKGGKRSLIRCMSQAGSP